MSHTEIDREYHRAFHEFCLWTQQNMTPLAESGEIAEYVRRRNELGVSDTEVLTYIQSQLN